METIIKVLREHPELALFVTLGVGYALGKIQVFGMSLGSVTGVLIAGVLVGQLRIQTSADFKSALLLLFLFSIGYRVGPQFFRGLKSTGLLQAGLTLFLCGTGLAVTYALSRIFNLDAGTAAGLVGGSLTESATLGTASETIAQLSLPPEKIQKLIGNATVAFAVTYFLGVITVVFFLSRLAPKILNVNLADECRKLEEEMGSHEESLGTYLAYEEISVRAYKLPPIWVGKSIGELESFFLPARVFVDRVHRGDEIFLGVAEKILEADDIVALSGRYATVVSKTNPLRGHEIDDKDLLNFMEEDLDMVLTNKSMDEKSVSEVAQSVDVRGVFLLAIKRSGETLPLTPRTRVQVGDILSLKGAKWHVERVAALLGHPLRISESSEMISVMAAIIFGAVIGLPAFVIGSIKVGLSLAVGVLVGGLIVGWLHSTYQYLGQIPKAALWIFDSLGLCGFLAMTAMGAGPDFVKGLKESGLLLVGLGIVTVAIPHLLTLLLGRHVFKIHPGILLGICAGAGTSAPALAAIQEVAKSKIPTLGYGITYAIGNIFLALWGSVLVALIGT